VRDWQSTGSRFIPCLNFRVGSSACFQAIWVRLYLRKCFGIKEEQNVGALHFQIVSIISGTCFSPNNNPSCFNTTGFATVGKALPPGGNSAARCYIDCYSASS
jgi:hypothetical protein